MAVAATLTPRFKAASVQTRPKPSEASVMNHTLSVCCFIVVLFMSNKVQEPSSGPSVQKLFFDEVAIGHQAIGGQMHDDKGVRPIGFQLVGDYFTYVAVMALNSPACDIF